MWFLIPKKIYKPILWVVWGSSPYKLSHFHSLCSFILGIGWEKKNDLLGEKPLLVGCSDCWCIPTMN
jgi:hypothetical protein